MRDDMHDRQYMHSARDQAGPKNPAQRISSAIRYNQTGPTNAKFMQQKILSTGRQPGRQATPVLNVANQRPQEGNENNVRSLHAQITKHGARATETKHQRRANGVPVAPRPQSPGSKRVSNHGPFQETTREIQGAFRSATALKSSHTMRNLSQTPGNMK